MAANSSTQSAGALFRQLRQERNTTLQQIADTQCSAAFISKFERGERDISFTRMRHLLDRINVSVEEFMFQLNTQSQEAIPRGQLFSMNVELRHIHLSAAYFQPFLKLVHLNAQQNVNAQQNAFQLTQQDVQELAHAGDDVLMLGDGNSRWQRFYHIYRRILIAVAKTNLQGDYEHSDFASLDDMQHTFADWSRPVTTYLYGVDRWGTFEFFMLRQFQFSMTLDALRRFTKLAVRRAAGTDFDANHELLYGILQGAFTRFVAARAFQDAAQCIEWHQELNINEDTYYGLLNRFMGGWLLIHEGQVQAGKQQCERLIALLKEIGLTHTARLWHECLDMVIASYEQPTKFSIFW